jgi:hypothetical protein
MSNLKIKALHYHHITESFDQLSMKSAVRRVTNITGAEQGNSNAPSLSKSA